MQTRPKQQKEKLASVVASPKNSFPAFPSSKAILPKATSPNQWKSETNLKSKDIERLDQSAFTEDSFSMNFASESSILRGQEGNPSQEASKKQGIKKVGKLNVKSPPSTLMRVKSQVFQKQEDKTKKFVNEKDEKLKKLSDRNLELEDSLSTLVKEREHAYEIIKQYESEKEHLEGQLKKAMSENRRLIKMKAYEYNENGSEIQELKAEIERLLEINKAHSSCETAPKYALQPTEFQSVETQTQESEMPHNQSVCARPEQSMAEFSAEIRKHYEELLREKQHLLSEQRELLHEQNIELNQLYERLQNTQTLSPSHQITQKVKQNNQQEEIHCLMQQVATLTQQVSSLKSELEVKNFFMKHYQANDESTKNEETKREEEVARLREELERRQGEIRELGRRLSQQESIIKGLMEKRPKVIIK